MMNSEPIYTNRSRATQLRRTDCVREGNSYYYKTCKCGETKENYKSSYCNTCALERINKGKVIPYAIDQTMFPDKVAKKKLYEEFLNEFVTRINTNNGMCSLEDIMVHLITLYNYFCAGQHLDKLSMGKQVTSMWKELQTLNMKINSKPAKPRSENGTRTCNKCEINKQVYEFPKTRNTCKSCINKQQKSKKTIFGT